MSGNPHGFVATDLLEKSVGPYPIGMDTGSGENKLATQQESARADVFLVPGSARDVEVKLDLLASVEEGEESRQDTALEQQQEQNEAIWRFFTYMPAAGQRPPLCQRRRRPLLRRTPKKKKELRRVELEARQRRATSMA